MEKRQKLSYNQHQILSLPVGVGGGGGLCLSFDAEYDKSAIFIKSVSTNW